MQVLTDIEHLSAEDGRTGSGKRTWQLIRAGAAVETRYCLRCNRFWATICGRKGPNREPESARAYRSKRCCAIFARSEKEKQKQETNLPKREKRACVDRSTSPAPPLPQASV